MVVPAAGVTVAVIVAVWKGLSMVTVVAMLIVGCTFTVTVTLAQVVVLQGPSALTKYVVVAATVTFSVAPVPTRVPPQLPLYHLQLAPDPNEPPLTLSVTLPGPHKAVGDALAAVGAAESEFTVMEVVAVTTGQPPAAANV
jgi:hypothetical protein